MVKGWHNEFERHSLARQGIKTGTKSSVSNKAYVVPSVYNISGVGSNSSVGFAFRQGATIGKSGHLKIVDTPTETLLVGYGWAVYGARDKATGKVTFYKGWDKYSRTTSKQLSETGLRGADIVVDEKRELNKAVESDSPDMMKSTLMVAKMGEFFGSNQKEKNDWKARMLKAGLSNRGLQMPEDWDSLSENEKETRLNNAIKVMDSSKESSPKSASELDIEKRHKYWENKKKRGKGMVGRAGQSLMPSGF